MAPKPYGYEWEKLSQALDILATGRGGIRQRLIAAAMQAHILGEPDRFPADVRPLLTRFWAEMTAVPSETEGSIAASVNAMSEEQAVKLAGQLRSIYFRVHAESGADEWCGGPIEE